LANFGTTTLVAVPALLGGKGVGAFGELLPVLRDQEIGLFDMALSGSFRAIARSLREFAITLRALPRRESCKVGQDASTMQLWPSTDECSAKAGTKSTPI
jgi:hypothetical protein